MRTITVTIPDLDALVWRRQPVNRHPSLVAGVFGLRLVVMGFEAASVDQPAYASWRIIDHDDVSLMGERLRLHVTEGDTDTVEQAQAAAYARAVEIVESALSDLGVRS